MSLQPAVLFVQALIKQRPESLRIASKIAKLDTLAKCQRMVNGVVAGNLWTEDIRAIMREVATEVDIIMPARINDHTWHSEEAMPQHQVAPNVHRAMEQDVQVICSALGTSNKLSLCLTALTVRR